MVQVRLKLTLAESCFSNAGLEACMTIPSSQAGLVLFIYFVRVSVCLLGICGLRVWDQIHKNWG